MMAILSWEDELSHKYDNGVFNNDVAMFMLHA